MKPGFVRQSRHAPTANVQAAACAPSPSYPMLAATSLAIAQAPPPETALPQGGSVVAGQATINSAAPGKLLIQQASQRAAIEWNSFNIGSAASVQFVQPNSQSVALNRVLSSDPSQIFGRLSSNGQVFLSNPGGVYFAPGARLDVGSLVATTMSISNADFMAGRNTFTRNGSTGRVINQGTLTGKAGGYIALLAPEVRNEGVISAQAGTVALAGGEQITLDFGRDSRLSSITVTPAQIKTLVENRHAVLAEDGQIIISARSVEKLIGSVVNTGTLSASSIKEQGGVITITADDITLTDSSRLEATGASGGGTVLIGGAGAGSSTRMHQASQLTMASGAVIDASATNKGDGGKVVLWTDIHGDGATTSAQGTILAKGGRHGGNGGFVETSGAKVDFRGIRVSTSAAQGATGLWLTDPYDLTIDASAASTINTNLASTNVKLQTTSGGASGPGTQNAAGSGDITINAGLSWTSGNTLTLDAYRHVAINATIAAGNNGKVVIVTGDTTGTDTTGTGTSSSATGDYSFGATTAGGNGNLTFGSTVGSATLNIAQGGTGAPLPYTLIYDTTGGANGLRSLNSSSGNFALANTLAGGAVTTAMIATFGNSTTHVGTFTGLGNALTNPVFTVSASNAGLFGTINGTVRDLGITGATANLTNNWSQVGLLAGNANGATIKNNWVTGTVNASPSGTNQNVGGLIGSATGGTVISKSYSSANVTGSTSFLGGLVGGLTGSSVLNSYASGNVTMNSGDNSVGGLIGRVNGTGSTVSDSHATGNVASPYDNVGGLVGVVGGSTPAVPNTFTNVYATGAVSGRGSVGGLIGSTEATTNVTSAYATGAVSNTGAAGGGVTGIGGLIGYAANTTNITTSYATGSVTGNAGNHYVGGLLGHFNSGTLNTSYATGNVSGDSYVGGLVGVVRSGATIQDAYAQGAVTSNNYVGGLLGYNENGAVTNVYSSGRVTGSSAGGLIGYKGGGTLTNGYWDSTSAGQSSAYGNSAGTTTGAMTTAQLQGGALPTGFNAGTSNGTPWAVTSGLYPYFAWQFPNGTQQISGTGYTSAGVGASGAAIKLYANGNLLSGGAIATNASGGYTALVNGGTITSTTKLGGTFTLSGAGAISGASYTDAPPMSGANVIGFDLKQGLFLATTSATSNSALQTDLTNTFGSSTYAALKTTLDTAWWQFNAAGNFNLDTELSHGGSTGLKSGGNLGIDAALTATGNTLTLQAGGTITDGASGSLTASNLVLRGGAVTLDSTTSNVTTLAATGVSSLAYTDADALTIGSVGPYNADITAAAINGTNTTTAGLSAAGNISVSAATNNLTINNNISTTAAAADSTLTLKAAGSIAMNSGVAVSTASANKLHTILWSDGNGNGNGAIALTSSSINSNGGDVTLGGGTNLATDYATYVATGSGGSNEALTQAGVALLNSSIAAGSGSVTMRGQTSGGAQAYVHGILIRGDGGTSAVTGGAITMEGIGGNNSNASSHGSSDRGISISTASGGSASVIGSGAVALTGTGSAGTGGTSSNNRGIFVSGGTVASTGSSVSLTGMGRGSGGSGGDGIGLYGGSNVHAATTVTLIGNGSTTANNGGTGGTNGVTIDGNTTKVYSTGSGAAGLTTITGTRGGSNAASVGISLINGATLGGASRSNDITLQANEYEISGAPTPIINTTGNVVVESTSAAFSTALNWGTTIAGPAASLRIGKTTNTADVTLSAAQNVAGPVSIYGGNLTLGAALTDSGASGTQVLFKATGNITINSNITATTNPTDIVLWADSDGSGAGAIAVSGATLTSLGGNVTLGGGLDLATGYATYMAPGGSGNDESMTVAGVALRNASITAGSGSVTMRGQTSGGAQAFVHGISIRGDGGTSAVTGGAITMEGIGGNSSNASGDGSSDRGISIRSDKGGSASVIGSGAVALTGTGSAGTGGISSSNRGIWVSGSGSTVASTGSSVSLTGTGRGSKDFNTGIAIGSDADVHAATTVTLTGNGSTTATGSNNAGVAIAGSNTKIYSTGSGAAGLVTVTGTRGASGTGGFGISLTNGATLGGAGRSNDITLQANEYNISGAPIINTTGNVIVESVAAAFGTALNWGIPIAGPAASLRIGKTTNTADVTVSAAQTAAGPISVYGGNLSVAALTAGTDITLKSNNAGSITQTGALTAAGLDVIGAGTATLTNTGNNVATLAANAVGVLSYLDSNALAIGTVAGVNGITATGAVSVATLTGDLTVSQSVATTNTGSSAITLNAGQSTAAGTATGGNFVVSGSPSITTGSGGRATLYSGSASGNSSLATLIGSGSGRFRYNSDEASTNYTTALGTGLYGIYREQINTGFTATNASLVYGTAVGSAGTATGLVNGDTATASISSASFSTSGNYKVGSYGTSITNAAALAALGYTSTGSTSGTLTITPKTLTVGAITASNKVYDGTTAATVSTSGASYTGKVSGDVVTVAATGVFSDKNVGTGKTVNLTSSYSGADAGNYTITGQASTTANITPASLTVSTGNVSKTYDGTTSATAGMGASAIVTAGQLFGSDSLSGGSFVYGDKSVGAGNKIVNVSGVSLSDGNGGANYTLSYAANTTSTITPKALTVSGITTSNKIYDATTAATISTSGVAYNGLVLNDAFSVSATGVFSDKNVANGKTVTLTSNYSGADVGNYTITNQASTTANITPKALTVSGITAANKVYDATTAATVSTSGAIYNGLVSNDAFSVSATGVFSDKNVANGKTVTLTSNYSGADVSNYTITNQASTTADITAATLKISTANVSKTYDGTTTVSGGSAVAVGGTQLFGSDTLSGGSFAYTNKNIGAGNKVVTTAGVSVNDNNGGNNYSVSYIDNTTSTITPKALTVSGITASTKIYDGTTAATVSTSGATYTGLVSNDVFSVSATGVFSDKNVANGKTVTLTSNYSGADVGNYTITNQASTTANITPKALTVSGLSVADRSYNGSDVATVVTGSTQFTGLIAGDAVALSSSTGRFANNNVGNAKTVTLTNAYNGADLGNYSLLDQATTTASITPALLTVSTANVSKAYDGTTSATAGMGASAIVTAGQLFGSDSLSGGSFVYGDKNAGAGSKVVNVSGVGLSDGNGGANYTLSYAANTTSTITPAALTISGITAANKVYDGTTAATVSTGSATYTGLVSNDVVTVAATGVFSDKNVANGKTVTLTSSYSGADVGNYTITGQANTTADITAAGLLVTANNDSRFVTKTDTAGYNGVSYSGFVGGDTAASSLNTSGLTVTRPGMGANNGASDAAGTYNGALLPGGVSASNYTISYASGNYTIIAAKNALVKVTNSSISYSGAQSFTPVSVQYMDGNNVIYTLTQTSQTGNSYSYRDGAGGVVSFTLSPQGQVLSSSNNLAVGNYTVADAAPSITGGNLAGSVFFSGNLEVLARAVTANASGVSKVYDGSTAMTGVTIGLTGQISGDGLSVNGTGAFSQKAVGSNLNYTLSGIALSGSDARNYYLNGGSTLSGSNGEITPKEVIVSGITAANKIYDRSTAATVNVTGASYAGKINGDDIAVAASGSFADKNVGTGKTVTLTSNYLGADAGNYTFVNQTSTTANITPKTLTLSGLAVSNRVYDGSNAATVNLGGANYDGLISGDSVTVAATGTYANKNVGANKIVTLSSSYTGADVSNYSIVSQASTNSDITPASLTITANAVSKIYDGTTAVSGGTTLLSGGQLFGTDSLSGGSFVYADKNVGTNNKAVRVSGVSVNDDNGGSNYNVTYIDNTTSSITAKAMTVGGLTANDKIYDGTSTASVNSSGPLTYSGLVSNDTVSLLSSSGSFADKNVGSNKAVSITGTYGGADAGNYAITTQGSSANITPATLTISGLTVADRVYNSTSAAAVLTQGVRYGGLIVNDNVSIATATGVFNNKNVGTGKTVTLSSSYSGADLSNYHVVDQATTTASITPAALSLEGISANSKTYDGNTSAVGNTSAAVYSGLFNGDSVTVSATGSFTDKNVGSNKRVSLLSSYSGADAGNYTITDQATTTATISTRTLTLSGVTAANKVYDGGTTANINANGLIYSGLVSGDNVSASFDSTGVFTDKNVGTNKTVSFNSNYSGTDLGNYSIVGQNTATADITPKALSVSGISAANKVYDGTTAASVSTSNVVYNGLVNGDAVAVNASGTFTDKNVGDGKAVNLSSSYSGADVSNYSIISQSSTSANITPATLNIAGITVDSRVYDGTVTAPLNLSAMQYNA